MKPLEPLPLRAGALMIAPSLVGRLLLREELTDIAIPVARVGGIALIALGVACWPGPPRTGMLIYSATITLYLAYVGFTGPVRLVVDSQNTRGHAAYPTRISISSWTIVKSIGLVQRKHQRRWPVPCAWCRHRHKRLIMMTCEERIKYPVSDLGRDAGAVVAYPT